MGDFRISLRNAGQFVVVHVTMVIVLLASMTGCHLSPKGNSITPQELLEECKAPSRSRLVPIDHRMLGGVVPKEHIVGAGDVLGIYVADILGKRGRPAGGLLSPLSNSQCADRAFCGATDQSPKPMARFTCLLWRHFMSTA